MNEAETRAEQAANEPGPRLPDFPSLGEYAVTLAQIVAKTSYLPNPNTVKALRGAAFPTVRNSERRITALENNGIVVGMYDDNTTPRWAMLWAHGIPGVAFPKGRWTFAHVWPSKGDSNAYTHLANLAMIPECFGSLTDKNGPLTGFLRWHAKSVYGWLPSNVSEPEKPEGYDEIRWNYFPQFDDPKGFIRKRLEAARCKRSAILRPLMFPEGQS
jgi:hypothetical protein